MAAALLFHVKGRRHSACLRSNARTVIHTQVVFALTVDASLLAFVCLLLLLLLFGWLVGWFGLVWFDLVWLGGGGC